MVKPKLTILKEQSISPDMSQVKKVGSFGFLLCGLESSQLIKARGNPRGRIVMACPPEASHETNGVL